MSDTPNPDSAALPEDPAALAVRVMEFWSEALDSVIESMTAERPATKCNAVADTPPAAARCTWWAQTLNLVPAPAMWIGASPDAWKSLGEVVLAALGVDGASDEDIQATCRDMVAQAGSALAQQLAQDLGEDVNSAGAVAAEEAKCDSPHAFEFTVQSGANTIEGIVLLDGAFVTRVRELAHPQSQPVAEEPADEPEASSDTSAENAGENLGPVPKVQLRVRVVLGRAVLPLRDIFKMNVGSVVELDRGYIDPADIMIDDHRIARGQIVTVKGNYGIKVTDLK